MKLSTSLYFILLFFVSVQLSAQCPDPVHPDYEVMSAIYQNSHLSMELYPESEWAKGVNGINCDPCSWEYVQCDAQERVTGISLSDEFGSIPEDIGDLPFLEILNINSRRISGEIPNYLYQWTNLKRLWISETLIDGELSSEIANLSNLEQIHIVRADLSGPIPPEIGQLSNLSSLLISSTKLSGTLPNEISQCQDLVSLEINGTDISGPIPASYGLLTNLYNLRLSENNLSGTIPSDLFQLSQLDYLSLDGNQLTGTVPSNLDQVSISSISLQNNDLSGCYEASLLNLCGQINLSGNPKLPWMGEIGFYCHPSLGFSGQQGAICDDGNPNTPYSVINANCECVGVPSFPVQNIACQVPNTEIGPLYKLLLECGSSWDHKDEWIDNLLGANCNPCTWPSIQCNIQNKVKFMGFGEDEWNARITGTFSELKFLEELYFSDDSDIRGFDPEFGNCTSLKKFTSQDGSNGYPFELPPELGNLISLEHFSLEGHDIQGSIPETFSMLSNLKILEIEDGYLCGEIPSSLSELQSLERLSFRKNRLEGDLPEELSLLQNLESINLSENKLTGSIPSQFSLWGADTYVDLSKNYLSGCIPPAFDTWCSLPSNLNLSGNERLPWRGDSNAFCMTDGSVASQTGSECNGVLYSKFTYGDFINYQGTIASDCTCDAMIYEFNHYSDNLVNCNLDISSSTEDIFAPNIDLKFYPNPANSLVELDLSSLNLDHVELRISNLEGKLMFSKRLVNTRYQQIDIKDFSNGLYLIELISDSMHYSGKLVKH